MLNQILRKKVEDLTIEETSKIVEELKKRLLIEHKKNDKSGIYAVTQYTFAYDSNHLEGSTLTKDETRDLFETGTIRSKGEVFVSKHVEEATGHFSMFNHMLHSIEERLSEELIKKLHYHLKVGVFEDQANGYPCGEYKNRVNVVSDIETALPENVPFEMQRLLEWYDVQTKDVKVLAEFHARYEKIHPFQDGNGRTGRMIIFRECLRNGIIPIMIYESFKTEYLFALNDAQSRNKYEKFLELFSKGQNLYYWELQKFLQVKEQKKDREIR